MKKILLFTASGLMVIALVLLLWLPQNRKSSGKSPFKAIPCDARYILKVNDIPGWMQGVMRENEVWQGLKGFEAVRLADSLTWQIDSFVRKDSEAAAIFNQSTLIVSAHPVGKSTTGFIWYLLPEYSYPARELREYFRRLIPADYSIVQRKYEGEPIIDLHTRKGELSASVLGRMLVISSSSLLLESAIRQFQAEAGITDDGSLGDLLKTSGKNVVANLFVRLPYTLTDNLSLLSQELRGQLQAYPEPGNWSAVDISPRSNLLLMSGFSTYTDSRQWLSLLQGQKPGKTEIATAFPASTKAYFALQISDYNLYSQNLSAFAAKAGMLKEMENERAKHRQWAGEAFDELLTGQLAGEVGIAYCDLGQENPDNNILVAIRVKSPPTAAEKLRNLANSSARKKGKPVGAPVTTLQIDGDTRLTIYSFALPGLFTTTLGSFFPSFEITYATVAGNYMLFAGSQKALSLAYHFYLRNNQLSGDIGYRQISEYFSGQNSAMVYLTAGALSANAPIWLNSGASDKALSVLGNGQGFNVAGLEFAMSPGLVFTNAFVAAVATESENAQTVWETLLDTVVLQKPYLVKNHLTGTQEVLVQDAANHLYLINSIGRILWKLPLEGSIVGSIFQVDAFRNNKLQYVFNTEERLYLVDRNGNFVERFPINLRARAIAGLSVFDYDGNRDYRLAIPAVDRKVYMYDISGNVVPGWDFTGAGTPISGQVLHCRLGDKDYLVFKDAYKLYMLDRKGSSRVSVKGALAFSDNPVYFFNNAGQPGASFVVTSDTAGRVVKIFFDGRTETIPIKEMGRQHWFIASDIDGDGQPEYIFADHDALTVYNQRKTLLFARKLDELPKYPPALYGFSRNDIKIGLVGHPKGKISLFNNDGSLYKGFPLKGNTPFSIGALNAAIGRFNLVVGDDNNFLINYTVK